MAVAAWYASLNAKRLDLIGDFAGKEKFFVEGDSLLFQCFSDPQLDFDPGFQLLHATYLVEKALSDLSRRGANIDIVFFEHNASHCVPTHAEDPSRYFLARTAIIKHLQHNCHKIDTKIFLDPADKRFVAELQEKGWLIALCSDGASHKYTKSKDWQPNSCAGLRTTISQLARQRIRIALLGGLTCEDNKILAFVLDHGHHIIPTETDDYLGEELSGLAISANGNSSIGSELRELGCETPSNSLRLRIVFNALAANALAEASPPDTLAALLHVIYLETLPLTDRCLGSIAFATKDECHVRSFTAQLSQTMLEILSAQNTKIDATVADLVDGRLLRAIVGDLQKAWDRLPMQWKTVVDNLMAQIGIEISTVLSGAPYYTSAKYTAPKSTNNDKDLSTVLPFFHPAFEPYLTSISVQEKLEKTHGSEFALPTLWDTSKKSHRSALARPREAETQKVMLRRQQRAFAQQMAYAKSLTSGDFDPKLIIAHKVAGKAGKKDRVVKVPAKSKKAQELIEDNKKRLSAKSTAKKPTNAIGPPLIFKSVVDQLQQDGPLLKRGQDAQDDPRVSFKPDPWQVKVLDELDAGNSLLLVAPTSSGKTFVSFYAMEKVLRASDNDVLVYVAPTKALVNQIAAEVIGKYKKNYQSKSSTSMSLVSIFTGDIKINHPLKSQILVTVPDVLQNMLLSPANKEWAPRIKTIIFDEVHSMASAEDGLIWEQLIMASSCQIIALSATIGNLSAFATWLSSTRAKSEKCLITIQHDQRWSDLRKYVYKPSVDPADSGEALAKRPESAAVGLEKVPHMNQVHPAAALIHMRHTIPTDLHLESHDCFVLWQEMKAHETGSFKVPVTLDPIKFFASIEIVKDDVARWANELKLILGSWAKDHKSPFAKVCNALGGNTVETSMGSFEDVLKTTMPLLRDLHANGSLPAILFNYNRKKCEDIATNLLEQLEVNEAQYKESSPKWKRKLEKFELWTTAASAKKQRPEKTTKTRGDRDDKMSQNDRGRDQAEEDVWINFDPEAPVEEFSFANVTKSDATLFETTMRNFDRAGIAKGLVRAFCRGIGVHHSGMNKWYRHAVEVFFRRGFLTVVIATGTLSLGINMPAKTVVFAGPSLNITALNYRQSSGRAGRRGFDLLGNVVFQSISTDRVLRLMSSELPDVKGHFTMTTVFVLRLLSLLQGTDNASYAMDMVDNMLSRTQFYQQGNQFKQQMLHHVRFSIEYLRIQGLLDPKGKPLGLASLVCALHNDEKGALGFYALLKEGYLFKLARDHQGAADRSTVLRRLMLVLSHLFGRRPMRASEKETEAVRIKGTGSTVFLEALPAEANSILCRHNEQILAVYKAYVASYVAQHCHEPNITLPLSKIAIKPAKEASSISGLLPSIGDSNNRVSPKLRSHFVALSGLGDSFSSISDLCDGVPGGVFLEKTLLPHLDLRGDGGPLLNAYLYDFFNHGSVTELDKANWVSRSNVWFVLNDFSIVLSTIVSTLEKTVLATGETDVDLEGSEGSQDDDDDFPEAKTSAHADASGDDENGEWDDGTATMNGSGDAEGQKSELERDMHALLEMFRHLRETFDEKFKRMWA